MTTRSEELGRLADHVDAVRGETLDPARVDAAQAALMTKLVRTRGRRSWRGPVRGLAWAAPVALIVTLATALFVGGPTGPEPAFADVQRYFEDFETLHATVRTEIMGQSAMSMDVRLERGGRTRIDMGGDVTHLVDPAAGAMVTLLHDSRTAMRVPLPSSDFGESRQELDWLHRIRDFQGQARRQPGMTMINGHRAIAFRLDQDELVITVWAAVEDGQPLRMIMRSGELMQMQLDFVFDIPLEDGSFDLALPPGYRWMDDSETG